VGSGAHDMAYALRAVCQGLMCDSGRLSDGGGPRALAALDHLASLVLKIIDEPHCIGMWGSNKA
jgi:hypothetical protein